MTRRFSALLFCLTLGLGLAVTGATTAQQPPGAVSLQDAADTEAAQREFWQNKYRALLTELDVARSNLEQDKIDYSKGRQRGRLRGGTREDVVSRIQEGETRVAELEAQVAAFPEEARRDGVPPGWLRDVKP